MKRTHAIVSIFLVFVLASCNTSEKENESTLINDMIDAGFVVTEGISSDILTFHEEIGESSFETESKAVVFENLYTFYDEQSDDYGYIYEIQDESTIKWFFSHKCAYSYYVNDTLFIYRIDNYVLEVYHSTDSIFPGYLRHYDVEVSEVYEYYYDDVVTSNTFVRSLIENGYEDITLELLDLDNSHSAFTRKNIELRNIQRLQSDYSSIIVISCNTMIDAQSVFEEQSVLMPVGGNNYYVAIIHQSNVYRIVTTASRVENILDTYFSEIEYTHYEQYDDLYNEYFEQYSD